VENRLPILTKVHADSMFRAGLLARSPDDQLWRLGQICLGDGAHTRDLVVLAASGSYIPTRRTRRVIAMVISRNSEPRNEQTSTEPVDEEAVAAELDLILARLEEGIPLQNRLMDALLSRLRTTLIAA
jgi:hypothetical protein